MNDDLLGTAATRLEPIFTVTGVRKEKAVNVKGKLYEAVEDRCFGWYPTLEDARQAVLRNACDINEAGHYPWVVVEEIGPGVYVGGPTDRMEWFEWCQEGEFAGEGSYLPYDGFPVLTEGYDTEHISGWGMG